MSNDFRTVPRYFLTTGLPAMIGELEVNVVDLSIKGARLQVTEPVPLGAVVPLGGVLLIVGWALLAVAAFQSTNL